MNKFNFFSVSSSSSEQMLNRKFSVIKFHPSIQSDLKISFVSSVEIVYLIHICVIHDMYMMMLLKFEECTTLQVLLLNQFGCTFVHFNGTHVISYASILAKINKMNKHTKVKWNNIQYRPTSPAMKLMCFNMMYISCTLKQITLLEISFSFVAIKHKALLWYWESCIIRI